MRKAIVLALLALPGCGFMAGGNMRPATWDDARMARASNSEVCSLSISWANSARIEDEVAKRGLNCPPPANDFVYVPRQKPVETNCTVSRGFMSCTTQ